MTPPLDTQTIQNALSDLPGWTLTNDQLTKTFEFQHFKEAFGFLTRVAFEAEAANHHPEITNVYRTVTLRLSTHDADGKVTRKDLDLAAAIESLNWLD